MRKRNEKGSLTIEATLSLSVFMFAIVMLLCLINVSRIQAKVASSLSSAAKEISQYSYLYGLTGLKEKEADLADRGATASGKINNVVSATNDLFNVIQGFGDNLETSGSGDAAALLGQWDTVKNDIEAGTQSATAIQGSIENLLSNPKDLVVGMGALFASESIDFAKSKLIAAPLAKALSSKHLNSPDEPDTDAYLKKMGVVGGLDGMDFGRSTLFAKGGDDIQLVVVYSVKIWELLPIEIRLTFCQTARTRGWLTGDASPYINPKTEAEVLERSGSLWDAPPNERAQLIQSITRNELRSSGYGFPKGFENVQAYNVATNEFVTVVTMNTFSDKYQEGFDESLLNMTKRLVSETQTATTVKVQTTDQYGAKTTSTVPSSDNKQYRIVLVIPEDATVSEQDLKQLLDANGQYNGVYIDIKKGFGEADPNKTIQEENPDADN